MAKFTLTFLHEPGRFENWLCSLNLRPAGIEEGARRLDVGVDIWDYAPVSFKALEQLGIISPLEGDTYTLTVSAKKDYKDEKTS